MMWLFLTRLRRLQLKYELGSKHIRNASTVCLLGDLVTHQTGLYFHGAGHT